MANEKSFWGDLDLTGEFITPVNVLKEQASMLSEETRDLLRASVVTTTRGETIIHNFTIVAPLLDGYEYEVFYARHGIELYPVYIQYRGKTFSCDDVDEFSEKLKEILSSVETHKVIKALLAQSK